MTRPAVLVTGGAHRIGAAIVRAFADAGWHVLIHYRDSADAADDMAARLPSAQAVQCDLADPQAVRDMAAALAAEHPDWQVLINCAAVFEPDSVRALDLDVVQEAMAVNAIAPTLLAQSFLACSTASGRRVIHVTDQKLTNPNPDFFSYTMSKHALDATVAMLAMGAAREEDRIYGLAPGAILPSHDQSDEEAQISHRMNPLHRRTGAHEVAQGALFLATGVMESGQTLFIDSGQHLLRQSRDVIYLARQGGPS